MDTQRKPKVLIASNPVIAKLKEPDREVRLFVSNLLQYEVPAAQHMKGKGGGWDGFASLYDMKTNTFPTGFVTMVAKRLRSAGYVVRLGQREAPPPLGCESPKVDEFAPDARYDYQDEVTRRLMHFKRGIAQVATGGGKSRIFKLCAERLDRPTMFLTTRKSLMYQMMEAYEKDIGKKFGVLGDGNWSPYYGGVNFAIVDTLTSRLDIKSERDELKRLENKFVEKVTAEVVKQLKKAGLPTDLRNIDHLVSSEKADDIRRRVKVIRRKVVEKMQFDKDAAVSNIKTKIAKQEAKRAEAIEFLSKMEFVCLEEAHEVSGNGFYEILRHCPNAHYRLALTATPFMKDSQEANMRLMASTGIVFIKVTEKDLIEKGILAKPYFKYAKPEMPMMLTSRTQFQPAYRLGITENESRNEIIVKEVLRAKRHSLPVMILVTHTNHGKKIEAMIAEKGVNVTFIAGADNQKSRQAGLTQLGSGELDVLIGTSIMDVGVDVPAVGLVILAGGGKAEVATRQRIGRGLRAKKVGPNVCFILDFEDGRNKHLLKHATERRNIVAKTPGFSEGIQSDFPYHLYGEK